MKLNEYLISNGVKLFIYSKGEPRQTNNLGAYDYAETSTMSSASMSGFATIASITMQS